MKEDKQHTDPYDSIRLGNQYCFPLYDCPGTDTAGIKQTELIHEMAEGEHS